jgi:hypothetical protein
MHVMMHRELILKQIFPFKGACTRRPSHYDRKDVTFFLFLEHGFQSILLRVLTSLGPHLLACATLFDKREVRGVLIPVMNQESPKNCLVETSPDGIGFT